MSASEAVNVPVAVVVSAGTTAVDALAEAGVTLTGPEAAVVVREAATGTLRDLAWVPTEDTAVRPVPANSADGRAVIRHSCAHVAAQAVQEIFPGTLLGIGPPVENGFYYDFLPEKPFTTEDLSRIEWHLVAPSRMQKKQVGSYDIAEAADGTCEVTYTLEVELSVGMLGMFRRKAEKMIMDTALKQLKNRVEGTGAGH